MLKSITVQNSAYFKDQQTLNFEDGAYFMIGENDSGKTSLFEIIHGCMSASKITHLTKPHNRDVPSFALCCFQSGIEKQLLMSLMLRWKKEDDGQQYLKLVYIGKTEKEKETLEAEYLLSNDWYPVNFEDDVEIRTNLSKIFEKRTEYTSISVDEVLQIINRHVESTSGTPAEASGSVLGNPCEDLLKAHIDEVIVITFPMRGISTCQWTESESLKQPGRKGSSEEIITWYLTKTTDITQEKTKRELTYVSQEEIVKEQTYFRLITNNSGVEFSYAGDELVVKNAAFQHQESSMLTISEGIYEAKKLSVLLAVKRFKTVCLDEPDRGMHPQMIERIRDLVLPQIKQDKIVLITTHHPSFLSPSTLPLVYSFRRRFEGNRCIAAVKLLLSERGGAIDKSNEHDSKTQGACGIGTDHPGPSKAKSKRRKRGKKENDEAQPEHENKMCDLLQAEHHHFFSSPPNFCWWKDRVIAFSCFT